MHYTLRRSTLFFQIIGTTLTESTDVARTSSSLRRGLFILRSLYNIGSIHVNDFKKVLEITIDLAKTCL